MADTPNPTRPEVRVARIEAGVAKQYLVEARKELDAARAVHLRAWERSCAALAQLAAVEGTDDV